MTYAPLKPKMAPPAPNTTKNPLAAQPQGPRIGAAQGASDLNAYTPTEPGPRSPMLVQAKLQLGQVNDPAEREADRISDMVISEPGARLDAPVRENRSVALQGSASTSSSLSVSPQLEENIHRQFLRGRPLDPATRGFMEPRFAADLSQVRIHTDLAAADLAEQLHARAFTHKQHIFFNQGEFGGDRRARRLVAHEVSHVLQQSIPDRSGTPIIRRSIKFYDNVGDSRTKIVDKDGRVRESDKLIKEFVDGLKKFFGITVKEIVKDDHVSVTLESSDKEEDVLKAQNDKIEKILKEGALSVPRPRGPSEDFIGTDASKDYEAASAEAVVERYKFVRRELISALSEDQDLLSGHLDVRRSTTDAGKTLPIRYQEKKAGKEQERVEVTPELYRDMIIHERTGWNGFWILTHEILHRHLSDDEKTVAGVSSYAQTTTTIQLRDSTGQRAGAAVNRNWTTVGEVEHALNMVRVLYYTPLRRGYTDLEGIRFSDFSAPASIPGGRRIAKATTTSGEPDLNYEYFGVDMGGGVQRLKEQTQAEVNVRREAERWRTMLKAPRYFTGLVDRQAAHFAIAGNLSPEAVIYMQIVDPKTLPRGAERAGVFQVEAKFIFDGPTEISDFGLFVVGETAHLSLETRTADEYQTKMQAADLVLAGSLGGRFVFLNLRPPDVAPGKKRGKAGR